MIDEFKKYTPRELIHELGECSTNDTASLLTSQIILCKMLENLLGTIATQSSQIAELSRKVEVLHA